MVARSSAMFRRSLFRLVCPCADKSQNPRAAAYARALPAQTKRIAALPIPPSETRKLSPALAGTMAASEPERSKPVRKPGHGVERRTERCRTGAGGNHLSVLLEHHADGAEIDRIGSNRPITEHKKGRGSVIRHRILNFDPPIGNARINNFETGHDEVRGGEDHRGGNARPAQGPFQDERDLPLRTRRNQAAVFDRFAVATSHVIE